MVLTETLLGLEFLLNRAVNSLDKQRVFRQLLSAHVKLLGFFVSCLLVQWRRLAIFRLLLILSSPLNDIFSDKLTIVSKFTVRIEVRSRKYFKLLFGELPYELLVFLQSVLLIPVRRLRPSFGRSSDLFRTGSWLVILRWICVETECLAHSDATLPLLHLLELMIVIWVTAFAFLHNHRSIIID